MNGKVVHAADVPAETSASGASIRAVLAVGPARPARSALPGTEGPGLVRHLVEVPGGAAIDGVTIDGTQLWFVIAGLGRLDVTAEARIPLRPDQGLLLPRGCEYRVQADGPGELRLDVVTLPGAATAEPGPAGPEPPQSRQLADCAIETTGDRLFRVLFGPGQGCPVATQFVGEIPPGRAPQHSHPYDEVVLVLAGQGTAHMGGTSYPLAAGTYLHLPPGLPHCLENTGSAILRVLGVFHPADSPATKHESLRSCQDVVHGADLTSAREPPRPRRGPVAREPDGVADDRAPGRAAGLRAGVVPAARR